MTCRKRKLGGDWIREDKPMTMDNATRNDSRGQSGRIPGCKATGWPGRRDREISSKPCAAADAGADH